MCSVESGRRGREGAEEVKTAGAYLASNPTISGCKFESLKYGRRRT